MMEFFSDDLRRDPYPMYAMLREASPLLHEPGTGLWLVFDYETVKQVLSDHETFSSRHGPADWLIFQDPPRQTRMRALISKAFTPRSIAGLEGRIGEICRELLDEAVKGGSGEMDVARDFAVPLPMRVIGDMLGIPASDRAAFERWNLAILKMSYLVGASKSDPAAAAVMNEFIAVTGEMGAYLENVLAQRRAQPRDDLLTRLLDAEIDGERLSATDILGFFQLLLLAGSETTTNLINNAMLCFMDWPDQLERLRQRPELLPGAIEEILRYRSPLQWMFRLTKREVELHGQTIEAGKVLLAMIGSANRDPRVFDDPEKLDIAREPNPHLAFGHGSHFCLGAPLARLEARIALSELLGRLKAFARVSNDPWKPRQGLHVHGPTELPIRFEAI